MLRKIIFQHILILWSVPIHICIVWHLIHKLPIEIFLSKNRRKLIKINITSVKNNAGLKIWLYRKQNNQAFISCIIHINAMTNMSSQNHKILENFPKILYLIGVWNSSLMNAHFWLTSEQFLIHTSRNLCSYS